MHHRTYRIVNNNLTKKDCEGYLGEVHDMLSTLALGNPLVEDNELVVRVRYPTAEAFADVLRVLCLRFGVPFEKIKVMS